MNDTTVTVMVRGPQTKMYPVLLDCDFAEDFDPAQWHIFRAKGGDFYCRAYCRPGDRTKGEPQSVMALLHRVVNHTPKGAKTDHQNRNTLDNRRCNLRTCTDRENNCNNRLRRDSTCGFVGVTKRSGWKATWRCWTAKISVDGRRIHLGYFATKEEAAWAYNEAALKYHGEFAKLNELPA